MRQAPPNHYIMLFTCKINQHILFSYLNVMVINTGDIWGGVAPARLQTPGRGCHDNGSVRSAGVIDSHRAGTAQLLKDHRQICRITSNNAVTA